MLLTAKSHRCCPRYAVAKGDLLSTPRFALSWHLNQSSLSHIVEYSIVVVVDVNWGPWTQGCRSLIAIVDGVFLAVGVLPVSLRVWVCANYRETDLVNWSSLR